ncbi:MAG: L-seryl-tRNA(Sec) selenium transferase [Planctomycetota bacterium]
MVDTHRDDHAAALRNIPQIDVLIGRAGSAEDLGGLPRGLLAEAVRAVVARFRDGVRESSGPDDPEPFFEETRFQAVIRAEIARRLRRRHLPVINATGILLHTGLGRAPLSDQAIEAVSAAARYAVVEIDPESGQRDHREVRVAELLVELTGAEAATVVNNNAAATMIALAALASGREVLVSRGELVEIGGGFRMPDVMAASGCQLREVGTTNRTYARDFKKALSERTGLLLKVHTSNFRLVGFTCSPAEEELAELARQSGIPYVFDLGSGLLRPVDLEPLAGEPSVKAAVEAGADLVTFSGDKLLCGPQAGILVGRKQAVAAVREHPMFRAMRPDKLQLAALEATLLAYVRQPEGPPDLPLFQLLSRPLKELSCLARHLSDGLARIDGVATEILDTVGYLGSGSAPARPVKSVSLAIGRANLRPDDLADTLRRGEPMVFARVDEGAVLLDMRTVFADEMEPLFDALVMALSPSDQKESR